MKMFKGVFQVRKEITDDRTGGTLAKVGDTVEGTVMVHSMNYWQFEPTSTEWIYNSNGYETVAAILTLKERK